MTQRAIEAVRGYLDRAHLAQIEFLQHLVREPTDNPPGDLVHAAEEAARLLEDLGLAVERHPVPHEAVEAAGMRSCTNLVVRERFGEDGPTVALNAHGDVVPPGGGWTTDPYGAEIREGSLYGRGAAVSKSDFATYAFAVLAVRHAAKTTDVALRGAVELHFTWDEETGGEIGPKWLLDRGLTKPDLVISAGFSYGIVTTHNGCLHLEVEVLGRTGHAARPETGVDALEAAHGVLADLYAHRRSLSATRSAVPGISSPTLVVGLVAGGVNTNVVPDRVVFRIDRRVVPEESLEVVEYDLTRRIEACAARWPGIDCRVRRVLFARPLVATAGQERLVSRLRANARSVFGVDAEPQGTPLYTDARHYGAAGIPTVLYGAGPRTLEEANGHRADEHLRLDDLHGATEVVARTLLDLTRADG